MTICELILQWLSLQQSQGAEHKLIAATRWAHLGYGFTEEDRDPEASTAPYLNADAIDDRWMELFTAPQLEKSASSVPNSV